jgi:dipeptidyl aminopeptidase/acylaminoacyl peptidase
MLRKNLVTLIFLITVQVVFGQYKVPDDRIKDVYEITKPPYLIFKPFSKSAFEITYKGQIGLNELVEEDLELAGKKFLPRINASRKFYQTDSFSLVDFANDSSDQIDIAKYATIRTVFYSWDYSKAIMTYEMEDGISFIYVDFKTKKITDYPQIKLNGAMGEPHVQWLANQKEVLIQMIPEDRPQEADYDPIPQSPLIEETSGKMSQLRTYTKLLKSPNDEILFDYYFTSQIAIVNLKSKKIKEIGPAGIYPSVEISPNNKLLLVTKINTPYSYTVPYYYFPQTTSIWNLKGKEVKHIMDRPLQDEIPIGGTYAGQRYHHWLPIAEQTLVWYQAQDEGDPNQQVEYRDIIYKSDYPFKTSEVFFKTQHRASGYQCLSDKENIIYGDYDRDRLWSRQWLLNLADNSSKLITDQSVNDKYGDRGSLFTVWNKNKERLVQRNGDLIYYINNQGASPEGNRPFLASFNIKTLEFTKLFEADLDKYEQISSFADSNYESIIIGSQNIEQPRNYQLVNLLTGQRRSLTNNQNPYPDYANLKKELVNYKRSDGIDLSGILYLPHDYDGKEKLPLIIHAYPREYASAETAGQVSGSDKTFTWYYGDDIRYLAMNGYAVLYNASIPIVGDPQVVNDTFLEQLLAGVSSAIDYLDEREIINPEKVGIIGHSYGAFMVANVLANSDLCQVGVAKSGAYNRTLTPFGFQKERRTFWQAKDFYLQVSPFARADQINEPLLLIHGDKDPNSGTYPMQTKRLYQAIKGNGGTARMVILPFEEHSYRAKESELHVLSEINEWFDKYLRNERIETNE